MNQCLHTGLLAAFSAAFFVSFTASAQKDTCSSGIYKTSADLLENRVSHRVPGGKKDHKFDFLFPADLKLTIRIITPDTTMEFKPGSVFGYYQCGRKHRYYEGGDLLAQEDYYRIEEAGGLVIYSSVFVSGAELFYSQGIEGPIRRLLMKNIEEDFAAHPGFVGEVKELGKKGLKGDLGKREKGRFEINRIYEEEIGKAKKK